jgi:hypothetical protein
VAATDADSLTEELTMTMFHPSIPSDRRINRHLLTRLATITIGWAVLEARLAEFLSYLLKADPGSMYVINQSAGSETQLRWIRTLSEGFTNENTRAGLDALFKRIDDARMRRNALVHGVWRTGDDKTTAIVQTIRLTRREWVVDELVTRADLDELIADIEEASTELNQIGIKLGFLKQ